MTTEQLIRPRIAAEKLGVSLSTIYRMFDRGEIDRVKITEATVGIPKYQLDAILNPELDSHSNLNPVQ